HPSAVMDIQYSNNNDQQNDILHGVFPDLIGGNPTLAVPLSQQLEQIKAADKYNDAGFNSFFKTGWKRFYLKWYEDAHPSASQ
ncbi:hypothetical protein ACSLO7_30610, partial [Klebsiella pneumoniae]